MQIKHTTFRILKSLKGLMIGNFVRIASVSCVLNWTKNTLLAHNSRQSFAMSMFACFISKGFREGVTCRSQAPFVTRI